MEEWKRKVGFKRGIFVFHNLAYYVIRGGGDIRFFSCRLVKSIPYLEIPL